MTLNSFVKLEATMALNALFILLLHTVGFGGVGLGVGVDLLFPLDDVDSPFPLDDPFTSLLPPAPLTLRLLTMFVLPSASMGTPAVSRSAVRETEGSFIFGKCHRRSGRDLCLNDFENYERKYCADDFMMMLLCLPFSHRVLGGVAAGRKIANKKTQQHRTSHTFVLFRYGS